ncbi:MAG: hypothetical protein LBH69_04775, partial [Methanomassiliicoccaceae archaeon]|nr:hypothetical protein [Methanomassiliicoccaceae archaeon]
MKGSGVSAPLSETTSGEWRSRSALKKGILLSLAITVTLLFAAFVAPAMQDGGQSDEQALDAGPFYDLPDPLNIFDSRFTASNSFTLTGGYIYFIELAGGAGETGKCSSALITHPNFEGGAGAILEVWVDLRMESPSTQFTFVYDTILGGPLHTPNNCQAGEGGKAIYLTSGGDLVMIAGGGGGGGAIGVSVTNPPTSAKGGAGGGVVGGV